MATRTADGHAAALSVVIATTREWPQARRCLDSFLREAESLGAEVILVDGSSGGWPRDPDGRYRKVRRLAEPGSSIFRLRSMGLAAARGEVVAITEDHCRPRPGWCAGHLEAHRRHPRTAAVGGPVENGARRRVADWALFLINHARYVPPLASGECGDVDRANISYKRRVLPREPSRKGMTEPFLDQRLRARGERFLMRGDLVIDHVQSLGLGETLTIAFHNARAVAGLRLLEGMRRGERAWRLLASPLVGPLFLVRTAAGTWRKRRVLPARAIASLPVASLLLTLTSAGFVAGYLAGPGTSAERIY